MRRRKKYRERSRRLRAMTAPTPIMTTFFARFRSFADDFFLKLQNAPGAYPSSHNKLPNKRVLVQKL
jgi:hypothetical protein